MKSNDIEYIFPFQVVVIIFFLSLLTVGIYGALQVESGLDLIDVVPRKSVEFVEARLKYFPFYPVVLVTQEFDYANQQKKLLSYYEEFKNVSAKMLWFAMGFSDINCKHAAHIPSPLPQRETGMFYVHTTREKFENATITGHFIFVFDENLDSWGNHVIIYHLLTESEVITGNSQTEALMYY